ncbi:hypothetical protein Ciccas_002539 [Cichlidogyrus casuarinus]|uniref:Uncharacterized protein n=1 Tax=Cichlidogyrus casuarinus TaxID=1844966 RepID=A0ABD2QGX5_9PLAT
MARQLMTKFAAKTMKETEFSQDFNKIEDLNDFGQILSNLQRSSDDPFFEQESSCDSNSDSEPELQTDPREEDTSCPNLNRLLKRNAKSDLPKWVLRNRKRTSSAARVRFNENETKASKAEKRKKRLKKKRASIMSLQRFTRACKLHPKAIEKEEADKVVDRNKTRKSNSIQMELGFPRGQQSVDDPKFVSKYEGFSNGGIPCFVEERVVGRACKKLVQVYERISPQSMDEMITYWTYVDRMRRKLSDFNWVSRANYYLKMLAYSPLEQLVFRHLLKSFKIAKTRGEGGVYSHQPTDQPLPPLLLQQPKPVQRTEAKLLALQTKNILRMTLPASRHENTANKASSESRASVKREEPIRKQSLAHIRNDLNSIYSIRRRFSLANPPKTEFN